MQRADRCYQTGSGNPKLPVLSELLKSHQSKPGLCLTGEYKATGRDSLVFLVDASKEMFIKGEDGQLSNFDMTMEVK